MEEEKGFLNYKKSVVTEDYRSLRRLMVYVLNFIVNSVARFLKYVIIAMAKFGNMFGLRSVLSACFGRIINGNLNRNQSINIRANPLECSFQDDKTQNDYKYVIVDCEDSSTSSSVSPLSPPPPARDNNEDEEKTVVCITMSPPLIRDNQIDGNQSPFVNVYDSDREDDSPIEIISFD